MDGMKELPYHGKVRTDTTISAILASWSVVFGQQLRTWAPRKLQNRGVRTESHTRTRYSLTNRPCRRSDNSGISLIETIRDEWVTAEEGSQRQQRNQFD